MRHPRTSPPTRRHSTPSGPWPFIDIDDEVPNTDTISVVLVESPLSAILESPLSAILESPLSASPTCKHSNRSFQELCWCRYPQSLFPNWTLTQQKKSKLNKVIGTLGESSLHYLDIMQDGTFVNAGVRELGVRNPDEHWAAIQGERPPGVRTTAIFVENLTGPVLQMLGTRYNIEPFFFSSSIGWIPSHYQSNVVSNREDHITITLVFMRPIQNPTTTPPNSPSIYTGSTASRTARSASRDIIIDTESPLPLRSSDLILFTEILALHIIRSPDLSTIISYHPTEEHRVTPAATMHARMHSMGSSMYWSRIFKEEKDPTFVVLSLLWYGMSAWDEAMDKLYIHICFLETMVLAKSDDASLTQELHLIRAHLLHYESLLRDFQNTILFMQDTPFPALQNSEMYTEEERLRSEKVMKRETENLLSELQRLETSRMRYEERLRNVMDLGFSLVNIRDSRSIQHLTEVGVQDSGALRQISYLAMVFLPPSFVAAFFSMNVTFLNPQGLVTVGEYVAIVVPLTLLTVWIVIALEIDIKQGNSNEHQNRLAKEEPEMGSWARFWWPFILISMALDARKKRKTQTKRAPGKAR